ncbi:MAG TPA: DNA methyltransferase [bacterium]|nr:DNA methyltransferase [bacterium]
MNYFFILGNHPALSLSELSVKIAGNWQIVNDAVVTLHYDGELAANLLESLGGTIKFGKIMGQFKKLDEVAEEDLASYLLSLNQGDGKIHFGLSNYSSIVLDRSFGLQIKRRLQVAGRSARWVVGRDKVLSSVIVEQNHLLTKGKEIVFWRYNDYWQWGITIGVQPFKGLSARDYGRPARDDRSGMLPPKLAQIMINLAGLRPGDILLDPFCGSGTILQEAALLGASKVIGIDNAPQAIKNSQDNWAWFAQRWRVNTSAEFRLGEATKVSQILSSKINRIVTEPYLGPSRGPRNFPAIIKELEVLYSQALRDWRSVITKEGRVVMIWPIFLCGTKKYYVQPDISGWQTIEFSKLARQSWPQEYTPGGHLIYGRSRQTVWRAIVGLQPV